MVWAGVVLAGAVPAGVVLVGAVLAGVKDAPVTPGCVVVAVAGVTVQVDADVAGGSGCRGRLIRAQSRLRRWGRESSWLPAGWFPSRRGRRGHRRARDRPVGARVPVDPDADGWRWADDPRSGAGSPGPPVETGALVGLGTAAPVAPPSASGPVPSAVVCAPAPLVPAPCCDGAPPRRSSPVPAWMIARRTGCTPSETLAMTAMPARPVASQSTPMRQVPKPPGRRRLPSPAWLLSGDALVLAWPPASRGR